MQIKDRVGVPVDINKAIGYLTVFKDFTAPLE